MSDLSFAADGACRGMDSSLFYPARRQSSDIRRAKAVCAVCPVIEECRAWALAHEARGVWGGLSARERKDERRRLGIVCHDPLTMLREGAA